MMTIIKNGRGKKRYQGTCPKCESILEFDDAEIKVYHDFDCDCDCDYVICPVCNEFLYKDNYKEVE